MALPDPPRPRAGVALPLALFVLLAVALLVALVLDAAVQELRSSRGELGALRVTAAVESAIADRVGVVVDSAEWLTRPVGAPVVEREVDGADTLEVTAERLGGALHRLVVAARSRAGVDRAAAGAVVFVQTRRLSPDSAFRLVPIPGAWWSAGR